jgi:septal ring factor EnvC (AmiA/AmiB activator)
MSDVTDWPLGERVRLPAPRQRRAPVRRRPLPRATWVLTGAAFVAGVLVSAAAFSIGWRHQAQHGSSTEAALAAATARSQTLRASLATARRDVSRTQAQLAAARKAKSAAEASALTVSREAATLASAIVAAGRSADSVSVGAGSVGSNLDKLAGELKTLTSYLTTTPTGQLDPGYIATQTAYLAKQLDELKAARSDLAAAIAGFGAGAKKLSDRAAALAGSN